MIDYNSAVCTRTSCPYLDTSCIGIWLTLMLFSLSPKHKSLFSGKIVLGGNGSLDYSISAFWFASSIGNTWLLAQDLLLV